MRMDRTDPRNTRLVGWRVLTIGALYYPQAIEGTDRKPVMQGTPTTDHAKAVREAKELSTARQWGWYGIIR